MDLLSEIELPTPPQTALRLIQLCNNPDVGVRELCEVVSLDAALSAKLLRAASSAYYGQQYEVSTLERAAVVLGFDHVKVVALGFHLVGLAQQCDEKVLDLRAVWQGNVLRACLARQLARCSEVSVAQCGGEAFLVGLLQDFAVPMVARVIGEAYADRLGQGGLYTTHDLLALEDEVAGSNHAHLAGRIFDLWRLPPLLTFAITNHHVTPPEAIPTDKAMALWQLAYWVGAIPFNEDHQTAPVAEGLRRLALAAFALDADGLGKAFYLAMEEYESLRTIFDAALPRDVDGAAILERARDLLLALEVGDTTEPPQGLDAQ